ncbi:hypothetical protein [Rheinheimera hassiensis]|uniref:hypothetical protein n=1 Tax=Rheinheimera hassiensis TaxID=1193627 RepID=UPI001F06D225|nr:hypothetical protein [Rheinheimera hassiensis]
MKKNVDNNDMNNDRSSPRISMEGHSMTVKTGKKEFKVIPLNCSGRGVAFVSNEFLPVGTQGQYFVTEIETGYSSIELSFTVVSVVTRKINEHLIGALIND